VVVQVVEALFFAVLSRSLTTKHILQFSSLACIDTLKTPVKDLILRRQIPYTIALGKLYLDRALPLSLPWQLELHHSLDLDDDPNWI
jgi:hypothetical protein